jgi:histidinol-phosphate aminotransferase
VADSDANFVLFGTFPERRVVWRELLDRGVLIREVGPPQWLRVTIGTPEEMAAFRAALTAVLAAQPERQPSERQPSARQPSARQPSERQPSERPVSQGAS